MTILLILAFLSGLTTGLLYHRVAAQDWQREVDKLDSANIFLKQQCMALDKINREMKQQQPRVGIDRDVGFVWWER